MELALAEARAAADEGEVPVGAVALIAGRVVAARHNEREGTAGPHGARRDAGTARCRCHGGWMAAFRSHPGRHTRTLPHVRRGARGSQGRADRVRGQRPTGGCVRDALQPVFRSATQPRARRHGRCQRSRVRGSVDVVLLGEADRSACPPGGVHLGRPHVMTSPELVTAGAVRLSKGSSGPSF